MRASSGTCRSPIRDKAAQTVTIKSPINVVASIGPALRAVYGMAGTFVMEPHAAAALCSSIAKDQ